MSSPEPDDSGGEAEGERDRHFHAADLCGPSTDARTCVDVEAIRNLRCDGSLGVDELDSQYRSAQQQAADHSDERGLQITHGLRLPSWNPRRHGAEEEHESYPEVESKVSGSSSAGIARNRRQSLAAIDDAARLGLLTGDDEQVSD